MSRSKTGVIIPVKTFAKAKKRLELVQEKKIELCKTMLNEVLKTVSKSPSVDKIAIVTKDEEAFAIGKRFSCVEIFDENELGVNNAVSLADGYFLSEGYKETLVFPQDIPLMDVDDIETLLSFQKSPQCVLVVPSRKFDGTNALYRKPIDIMKTHYDEDSYKIHLTSAKNTPSFLVLIRRMMFDVDTQEDLELVLKHSKPISKIFQ